MFVFQKTEIYSLRNGINLARKEMQTTQYGSEGV